MLKQLAEPENAESGLIGWKVGAGILHERNINEDRVLHELAVAGLVERRSVPHHKTAKPYFITDAGRQYLAEALQKAVSNEPGQRLDWSASEQRIDVRQAISTFLRTLPEFSASDEERIEYVSRKLEETISQAITPKR